MQSQRPWLIFVTLSIGIALRLLYLDADPYYYEWVGYIIDEGRWVQHARSLVLHHTLVGGHAHNLHLFVAPLFQLVHYLIFSLAGVSIWTSRVFTALCGGALLVLFWWGLRQMATPQALLLGVALLASQADLVELSRVAIPEMTLMLFQLLIYFLLVQRTNSLYCMLLAGFLLLIAVGMKATVAPMVVIFSVLLFFMPRPPATPAASTQRWRDLRRFWCGFAAPVSVVGLLGVFYLLTKTTFTFPPLLSLMSFLRLSGAYNKVAFLFEDTLSPTLNFWALGLWLSVLAWTAKRQSDIDFLVRRYLTTSAIWFVLYFFFMLFPEYFPTRYKVHILLPIAVNITVGLSLLQRMGVQKVIESFAQDAGVLRLFRLWLLSLPTAAFLAPLLALLIGLTGVDGGRLRFKLACFVVVMIPTVSIAHRLRRRPQAIGFFLVFPLIGGLAWLLWSVPGMYSSFFWPQLETAAFNVGWALFLLLVFAAAVVRARSASDWRVTGSAHFITAYAGCYLIVSLINLAPAYIDPHYSIRDASRDLAAVLTDSSSIEVSRAEGLFNNNTLRYKSLAERTSAELPEAVVVGFIFRGKREWIEQHYRAVKTYNLYVSPEYTRLLADDLAHPSPGESITVYKRKDEPDAGDQQATPQPFAR